MNKKKKYRVNNIKKVTGKRRFKCLDCGQQFGDYNQLVNHSSKYHKDLIGNEDIHKYLYLKRNPGPKICVVCKKNPCEWDPIKRRFKRMCGSKECNKKARELFRKNMIRIYKKDSLLHDAEQQQKMLLNRRISGVFTFPNGDKIGYVGKFELDFLDHIVALNLSSEDILPAPAKTYTKYYNEFTKTDSLYIPDFYMPRYNLIIEIKDGSKYPIDSKAKMVMKEKAIINRNEFNFIKIIDKDYTDFDNLIKTLDQKPLTEIMKDDNIFIIPDSEDDLHKAIDTNNFSFEDINEEFDNIKEIRIDYNNYKQYKIKKFSKESFGLAIVNNENLIGYIECNKNIQSNEVYINDIFIDPKYRNNGFGSVLISNAKLDFGINKISINDNNIKALALCKKNKFKLDSYKDKKITFSI